MNAIFASGTVAWFAALFIIGWVAVGGRREHSAYDGLRAALKRRPPNPKRSFQAFTDHASAIAERSLEQRGKYGALEQTLERAGLDVRPGEFVVLAITLTFAAFAIGAILGGILIAVIAAACVAAGTRFAVTARAERRVAKFDGQLEETVTLMAGSLRAGFGLMQTLDAVAARESQAPTSEEFRRLVMESRLGRDLGDSLDAMAERVRSQDFHFVVQAIEIHRSAGGDLAEVLDKVAATIRDRNRVRRQVQTLSAEGRMSAMVLFALPFVMFVVIAFLNPSYFHVLTGTTAGKVLIGIGLALLAIGGLWTRRLIRLVY